MALVLFQLCELLCFPSLFLPSQILADELARGVARLEGAMIIRGVSLSLRLWPARLVRGGFALDFRLHQRDGSGVVGKPENHHTWFLWLVVLFSNELAGAPELVNTGIF